MVKVILERNDESIDMRFSFGEIDANGYKISVTCDSLNSYIEHLQMFADDDSPFSEAYFDVDDFEDDNFVSGRGGE